MLNELRPQLVEKVTTILETMFFLFVEPVEGPPQEEKTGEEAEEKENSGSSFIKATIGLQGKRTGTIQLHLPYGMAQKMAVNFLGMEEENILQNQILDMVGELINMISGNLISCMGGPGEFALTIPQAELSAPPLSEKGNQGEELDLYFQAEEGWGKLEIRLEEG